MKFRFFPIILLCLFAIACKEQKAAEVKQEPPKKIVLEIGNLKASDTELKEMFSQLPLEQKTRYLNDGSNGMDNFVNDLAEKQLLIQAAKDGKLSEQPGVHATLQMAENSVLYSAYYRTQVLDKTVPETEVKTFYDANKDRFFNPEQVKIRHILVTPRTGQKVSNATGDDAKTEAEAKKKIERLIEQLKGGANFEEIARQYSEDPSAANGGNMDYLTRGRTVKEFEDAAFSLAKPGQVAGPVKSEFGYHIIQLLDKREKRQFAYEDVRNEIQTQLASQRAEDVQKAYDKLIQELQVKYPKKVNLENLK